MKETWPKAALALAKGDTIAAAARAASVSKRTLLRWRSDEVRFADEVETLRSEMLMEAAGLLAATATSAVRKLDALIAEGEDRHALAAARTVLDMASRYRLDQALESRIVALELSAGLRQ